MITFAHIGLHKTASTWLQVVLDQHPDIALIRPIPVSDRDHAIVTHVQKIAAGTQYGEVDILPWREQFDSLAQAFQANRSMLGISNENLGGGMINGVNCYLVAERLYQAFGTIKIILVLRHPLDYFSSAYAHYVKQGGTLTRKSLLLDGSIPGRGLVRRFNYARLIKNYEERFGPENLLILPYELLREDRNKYLAFIWQFLDIEPLDQDEVLDSRANPGYTALMIKIARLVNCMGGKRERWRPILRRLDRRVVKYISRRDPPATFELLATNLELAEMLVDENYELFSGDLARFDYTF